MYAKLILSILFFLSANILFAETNIAQRTIAISNSWYVINYQYDQSNLIQDKYPARIAVCEIINGEAIQISPTFDGYYIEGKPCPDIVSMVRSCIAATMSDLNYALKNRIKIARKTDLAKNEK